MSKENHYAKRSRKEGEYPPPPIDLLGNNLRFKSSTGRPALGICLILLILICALALVACINLADDDIGSLLSGNGGSSSGDGGSLPADPTSAAYDSVDAANSYNLIITNSSAAKAAAYIPKADDKYVLTITSLSDLSIKTSSGKVTAINGGTFTLTPMGATVTFEVTTNADDGTITAIAGTITLDGGKGTETASGTMTPGPPPANPETGGGTVADPYIIKNAADLARMAKGLDKYYKLDNSITISGPWTPIGPRSAPFTGVFDGNGKTITFASGSSLGTVNDVVVYGNSRKGNVLNAGIFGVISGNSSEVKNLTVAASSLLVVISTNGEFHAGVIAGELRGSPVINGCTVNADLSVSAPSSGSLIGGIAGVKYESAVITGCTVNANISLSGGGLGCSAGGIAGSNNGPIENCHTAGTVTIDSTRGFGTAGGIVGSNNGPIKNCHAAGTVTGGAEGLTIGGIVGSNAGSIENSYSTGAISGGYTAGGIAGGNNSDSEEGYFGVISTCYATGTVMADGSTAFETVFGSGSDAGGIVGVQDDEYGSGSKISNCVALNTGSPAVSATRAARRIVNNNGGTLANNWGASMTVTEDGSPITPGSTAGGEDGADFTNSGQASWSAAIGLGPAFAFGSNDAAPWVWDAVNNRPKLYWE